MNASINFFVKTFSSKTLLLRVNFDRAKLLTIICTKSKRGHIIEGISFSPLDIHILSFERAEPMENSRIVLYIFSRSDRMQP